MIYLFSAIILLGVLIAIHEFGHFIVGRMCNIHIYRFSIGMGPVIFKTHDKQGAEIALSALPLGGYVAFHTEKSTDEDSELLKNLTPEQLANTFESKPKWQRACVMLAGPVANFILAIGILSVIFANSVERQFLPEVSNVTSAYLLENSALRQGDMLTSINGKRVANLQQIRLELLSHSGSSSTLNLNFVSPDSQAEKSIMIPVTDFLSSAEEQNAPEGFLGFGLTMKMKPIVGMISKESQAGLNGLKINDLILSANSQKIVSFEDLALLLQGFEEPSIELKVQRASDTLFLNIPLLTRINESGAQEQFIGIQPGMQRSWLSALSKGAYETYNLSAKTLTFIGKMVVGDLGTQNLSGPIGIVQMAGDTAKAGFLPFLYLMALLSISLGVMNLLPIPVLDGGQLVMLGVEAVRGSPMPEKMENLFFMSGWVAVGCLMVFAIFNDISKFL
ncbi:RIP metalloprotease RseP [Gammaproteobacteria bacterium]|nr:RIP metalloprotease RseP [Gammaproteobacteria bacterium]